MQTVFALFCTPVSFCFDSQGPGSVMGFCLHRVYWLPVCLELCDESLFICMSVSRQTWEEGKYKKSRTQTARIPRLHRRRIFSSRILQVYPWRVNKVYYIRRFYLSTVPLCDQNGPTAPFNLNKLNQMSNSIAKKNPNCLTMIIWVDIKLYSLINISHIISQFFSSRSTIYILIK